MPVLDREESIEQAYFFHTFRERVLDGVPSQEVLSRVGEELLSTTRLPLAVSFLATEIKVIGPDGAGDGPAGALLHGRSRRSSSPGPRRRSAAGSRWSRRC